MTDHRITTPIQRLLRTVLGGTDLDPAEALALLTTGSCDPLTAGRRGRIITSRVRLIATILMTLTPLWIAVDLAVFPALLALELIALRCVATAAFGLLAVRARRAESIHDARVLLATLFLIATAFFTISHPVVNAAVPGAPAAALSAGYAFLPFVMIAGLALFPLGGAEALALTAPMLAVHVWAGLYGSVVFPFSSYLGALWLLVLIAAVAAASAMSQMHFLTALVEQVSRDTLTGAYTRRAGEDLLRLLHAQALRTGAPLSLAFVDLDHFKSVNDIWGHEEGDRVLRAFSDALHDGLRRTDPVIRWGGEEFLLVMPGANADGARVALERICSSGICRRPDGSPQTASVGIAEIDRAAPQALSDLIDEADRLMYKAKKGGRACIVDRLSDRARSAPVFPSL